MSCRWRRQRITYYRDDVIALDDLVRQECYWRCRSSRFASRIAVDYARSAVRTLTLARAHVHHRQTPDWRPFRQYLKNEVGWPGGKTMPIPNINTPRLAVTSVAPRR